jgi:hypothetical protein
MKQQFDIERYPNSTWSSIVSSESVTAKDPGNAKKRKKAIYAGESSKQPRICDLVVTEELPKFTEYLAKKNDTSAANVLLGLQKTKFPADEIDIQREMTSMEAENAQNEFNFLKSCDLGNCGLDDESLANYDAEREREQEEFLKRQFEDL